MRTHACRISYGMIAMIALACCCFAAGAAVAKEPSFAEHWSASTGGTLLLAGGKIADIDMSADKAFTRPDLVTVNANFLWDRIYIMGNAHASRENGRAKKEALQEISVQGAISGVAVADFNGDGFEDFAVADFIWGRVEVYVNDGQGKFKKAWGVKVGEGPIRLEAGDFNEDGKADIVTANLYDSSIAKAYGDGSGRFQKVATAKAAYMAGTAMFTLNASASVDYTAIKQAVAHTTMSSSTRSKLEKYLTQSENAYNAGNRRKAIRGLEKFIKQLNKNRDSQLSEADRRELIDLAKDLIKQILESREVTATFTADPSVVAPGGSSTLTWSTTGAVAVTIDNGIGSVPTSGSTVVTPAGTTTYTLLATAASGATATASATVYVGAANMIYVDAARGSDSTGNGTYSNPYQSITKGLAVAGSSAAREAAAAAMNVSVAAGYYDSDIETLPLVLPAGVGVYGAGTTKTLISGTGNAPDGRSCTVYMGEGSTLDGVKVTNTTGSFPIVVNDVAAAISNCLIPSAVIDCIEVVGAANLTMTGSTVTNAVYDGLWFQDTSSATVSSNTLSGHGWREVAVYYNVGAVTINGNTLQHRVGNTRPSIYALVSTGNTFSNNNITGSSGRGIYSYYFSSSTISGNSISGAFTTAVYSDTFSVDTITSNSISGCAVGIRAWDANPTVTGNTITGFTSSSGGIRCTYFAGGVFRSNTVTGGTAGSYGVRITGSAGVPDFGTAGSPGGNTFRSLPPFGSSSWNLRHEGAWTIYAQGNTWNNAPPTRTTGAGTGFDIREVVLNSVVAP